MTARMHPVDSKEIAFQIAGREAFKQGFREAKPILLEPIWHVEVKVPDEYMGDVMGDLSSRRGKILGMDAAGKYQLIKALVPLAELYQLLHHPAFDDSGPREPSPPL